MSGGVGASGISVRDARPGMAAPAALGGQFWFGAALPKILGFGAAPSEHSIFGAPLPNISGRRCPPNILVSALPSPVFLYIYLYILCIFLKGSSPVIARGGGGGLGSSAWHINQGPPHRSDIWAWAQSSVQ